jgi:hypothetical protein
MRWLFMDKTELEDVIESLTEVQELNYIKNTLIAKDPNDNNQNYRLHVEVLKHYYEGNDNVGNLWKVVEWKIIEKCSNDIVKSDRLIYCHMLRYNYEYNGWDFNVCNELDNPYAKDCPIEFLDIVPAPDNNGSMIWRSRVQEYYNS